ncbi:MAG: hypothetical protein KGL39_28840 [Patescibacteria group bacterium]|nr:hypothetical protein [Patescibacteria group bacterium]
MSPAIDGSFSDTLVHRHAMADEVFRGKAHLNPLMPGQEYTLNRLLRGVVSRKFVIAQLAQVISRIALDPDTFDMDVLIADGRMNLAAHYAISCGFQPDDIIDGESMSPRDNFLSLIGRHFDMRRWLFSRSTWPIEMNALYDGGQKTEAATAAVEMFGR